MDVAGVPRSRAMSVNPGRYMSMANGPTAESIPRINRSLEGTVVRGESGDDTCESLRDKRGRCAGLRRMVVAGQTLNALYLLDVMA